VRRLRETRKKLLRAGAVWWEAKSANAALVAIVESGVKLRKKIVNENGEVEIWRKPQLADWEKPRRDPGERRPLHPVVSAQRRAARQRWRARRRAAREAACPLSDVKRERKEQSKKPSLWVKMRRTQVEKS